MTTDEFISTYRKEDVRRLALQAAKFPDVDMPFALDQIAGWQAARRKLPSWAAVDGLVYPPHISMEQCSSEATARYKRSEEGRWKNEESNTLEGMDKGLKENAVFDSSFFHLPSSLLIDLTGGFGVDFSFLSHGFSRAVYVERQPHLCDVARKNFALLGLDNAEVVCGDGVEYLQTIDHAAMIYLDPARRDSHGGRTYAISDCTPDVLSLLPILLSKADRVMVKLSPMLDWHETVRSLNAVCPDCVAEVHIVSVCNECKEMLVVMTKHTHAPLTVHCANLSGEGRVKNEESNTAFSFVLLSNPSKVLDSSIFPLNSSLPFDSSFFPLPSSLSLYEPNASIMKAGCFSQLCERYGVRAVGRNSHLFVSDEAVDDFPGCRFRILATSSMNKKEIKKALSGIDSANITVRNFPLSVAELRKRLKLKDGGDTYIFATTVGADNRHLLFITQKWF